MSLIAELRRRNVFRVGVAYAIVGWLLVEVASVVLPTFKTPEWVLQAFTFLVILGFPLALVFAWAFELTPEGFKRAQDVHPAESIRHLSGRKLDFAIIALLAIAVVFLVVDNYVLEAEPEQVEVVAAQVPATESTSLVKSIAVLPFVNMSGDPEQEFFSDGITEELLNTLTAIEELRVVGRTSSFSFKGKDIDLRTIGESLGVTNILEGSVRQFGGRLRITAQLINVADGFHLWSNSYDRELADIFEIQEEIAGEIASALQVELGFQVAQSVAERTTDNLEAYTWFLRGWDLLSRDDITNLKKARAALKKAIELDPEYVPAYVGYAAASMNLLSWGLGPADDLLDDAERRLREAQVIDPGSSMVHVGLGDVRTRRRDWVGAEQEFKKALDLDPDNYRAQSAWAFPLHEVLGRPREAVQLYEQLRWREPLHLNLAGNYAMALAQAGRVEEAEKELQRIIEIDPTYSGSHYFLGLLNAYFRNQLALAIRSNIRAFELDSQSVAIPEEAVLLLLDLGDVASAERWVELAERNSGGGDLGNYARFSLALYRGDEVSAEAISRELAETAQRIYSGYHYSWNLAWLRQLHAADPQLAMEAYRRLAPELLQEEPKVGAWNHGAAISLADWMRRAGDAVTANSLLEKSLSVISQTTDRYYPPARATAYLLQGDTQRALAALREAVAGGWRSGWWLLEREPIYEPLWALPEFQSLMAEVRADMAAHLAQVREMERTGELEPIPELGAE
jgi:TolB-like protein/Flp pilus assembly protein TadD